MSENQSKNLENVDVCIVGSGAAGVTAAWYLQAAGYNVVLADAGRPGPGTGSQGTDADLIGKRIFYSGETTGQFNNVAAYNEPLQGYDNCTTATTPNEGSFLTRPWANWQGGPWERERTYGGTTAHFGGQSRPLDPITYDGVPNGTPLKYPAWPVNYDEMAPYIKKATDFLHLMPEFDAEYYAQQTGGSVPRLNGFNTEIYQFLIPNADVTYGNKNFAFRKFGGISVGEGKTIAESNATVIRNATLVDMDIVDGEVQAMNFASMTGGESEGECPTVSDRFSVSAKYYVLALGAVENARQMLLSNMTNPNIGRYFMCHPWSSYGTIISISEDILDADQSKVMGGTLNGIDYTGRFILSKETAQEHNIGRMWFRADQGQGLYMEMTPNPASTVTLSEQTDKVLNQPLSKIDWQLSDDDITTYNTNVELFKQAVEEFKPGATVTALDWNQFLDRIAINGHHLGTTRMSDTAEDGVVDKNLRSHDVNNLFCAGSSVWTNAGISNPTFTIVMFSIRLAEYLGSQLGGGK